MNALKVITLAALAACGSTQYVGLNGLNHGYHGLHHGYHGLHHGLQHSVHHGYSGLLHGTSYLGHQNYASPYAAPYAPVQTQYHSQDELGQYSFGYSGGPSDRAETRDAYGNVRGHYNYIDSNGQVQTTHYVADTLGFRVSGTNLPVGPAAPAVAALVAPEPVVDTPEVVKARKEFLALYNEAAAAAAAAAAPDARKKRSTDLVAPEPVQDTAEVAQAKAEFAAAYEAAAAAAEAAPDKGPLEDYAPVYHHHGYSGLHHGYAPLHGLNHLGYSGLANGYAGIHHGLTHHGLTHHGLTHHGLTHHGLTHPGLTHHGLTHHGLTHPGLTHHALPYAYAHPSRTVVSYAHGLNIPSALGHAAY